MNEKRRGKKGVIGYEKISREESKGLKIRNVAHRRIEWKIEVFEYNGKKCRNLN